MTVQRSSGWCKELMLLVRENPLITVSAINFCEYSMAASIILLAHRN